MVSQKLGDVSVAEPSSQRIYLYGDTGTPGAPRAGRPGVWTVTIGPATEAGPGGKARKGKQKRVCVHCMRGGPWTGQTLVSCMLHLPQATALSPSLPHTGRAGIDSDSMSLVSMRASQTAESTLYRQED